MKCFHCGKTINENVKFCNYCGISQEHYRGTWNSGIVQEKPKKKISPLAIVLPIVGVVLLAAVVTLILVFGGGSAYISPQNTFWYYYDEDTLTTEVFLNGNRTSFSYPGKFVRFHADCSGESAVVLTDGGELISINSRGTYQEISSSVAEITRGGEQLYAYQLSLDGKTVAYIDEHNVLYLYRVDSRQTMKIADRAEFCQLSAGGTAVVYRIKDVSGAPHLCMTIDGTTTEILGNYYPAAVSDDGKILYALCEEMYLYRLNDAREMEKISQDPINRLMINLDCTELIYEVGVDRRMYVIGERFTGRIPLGSYGYGECLLPSKIFNPTLRQLYSMLSEVDCLPVKSFAEQLFLFREDDGDHSLVLLNEDWELFKLVSGVAEWSLSNEAETLFYTQDGVLYLLEMDNVRSPQRLDDGVIDIAASDDGNWIYYIIEDDKGKTTLWRYDRTAKRPAPEKMEEDVRHILMSPANSVYFLMNYNEEQGSGILYAYDEKGDKHRLAEEVYRVTVFGELTVIWTEYDPERQICDMQLSLDSIKFTKINSDVCNQQIVVSDVGNLLYTGRSTDITIPMQENITE